MNYILPCWILFCILRASISSTLNVMPNNCMVGSYRSTTGPFNGCSGFKTCELGYYCKDLVRFPCPPGRYGSSTALQNSTCSGECPSGYYCPQQSISPNGFPCGDVQNYCPPGSFMPSVTAIGYYTINSNKSNDDENTRSSQILCPPGSYCTNARKFLCPFGTFGEASGLTTKNCSGLCPEGWYCPPGTIDKLGYSCT